MNLSKPMSHDKEFRAVELADHAVKLVASGQAEVPSILFAGPAASG